jgi:D-cysteine desulfhydrase
METPLYALDEYYSNHIYIKRDDLYPYVLGGNKARKARLFFSDIEAKGADCVVTYGNSSSNHCRAVSIMAAAKGLKCVIITPEEYAKETSNTSIVRLCGAEYKYCLIDEVKTMIDSTMCELEQAGFNPYFIPGGGHGLFGTLAYVEAYNEIQRYEEENDVKFDYIFHASGTGTTQAGLICGSIIQGNSERIIIGISIARSNTRGAKIVVDSVNEYLGETRVGLDDIYFIDEYTCGGYGIYNDSILSTMHTRLVLNGIPLDSTYTGKAFWGMEEYIKAHDVKNSTILFIHTGGTPLFYDDLEIIK